MSSPPKKDLDTLGTPKNPFGRTYKNINSHMSRNKRQRGDGEEQQIWNDCYESINKAFGNEASSADIVKEIFELEKQITAAVVAGTKPSVASIDGLGQKYRDGVKLAEDTKSLDLPGLINKIEILKGMVEHNEGKRLAASRASSSRDPQNAMDFDGPSDSPVPSPADNKHIRKMGPGRPSSQPPRDKDSLKEDKEDRKEGSSAARTRITFELNEEVAFKPKIANQTQEQDWIKGIVVKVIGEGKSRRYDVRDAEPDDPNKPVVYRSSASSMVPIPSEATPLPDYEAGKRVLALYPRTSTYYRAEVQGMTADKKKVRLLFEEESLEEIKEVDRHDVLDHKG